jgi:predicted O-methyltransferase YrrM
MALKHGWTQGTELGVKQGQTLFYLLDKCPRLRMIGVDIWAQQPQRAGYVYNDWPHNDYEREVRERSAQYPGRIRLLKMKTSEAANHVEDGSQDFVFIDADHLTDAVCEDIEYWQPKVRPGGVLCGHDAGKKTVRQALNKMLFGWVFVHHDNCWMMEL